MSTLNIKFLESLIDKAKKNEKVQNSLLDLKIVLQQTLKDPTKVQKIYIKNDYIKDLKSRWIDCTKAFAKIFRENDESFELSDEKIEKIVNKAIDENKKIIETIYDSNFQAKDLDKYKDKLFPNMSKEEFQKLKNNIDEMKKKYDNAKSASIVFWSIAAICIISLLLAITVPSLTLTAAAVGKTISTITGLSDETLVEASIYTPIIIAGSAEILGFYKMKEVDRYDNELFKLKISKREGNIDDYVAKTICTEIMGMGAKEAQEALMKFKRGLYSQQSK